MSLETLRILAETANETKNASFTITRTKQRIWKVTLLNSYDRENDCQRHFDNKNIELAAIACLQYIQTRRKVIEVVPITYEL
jgi:hypothetical protein